MISDISSIKRDIGLMMSAAGGPGTTMAVYWNVYSGTLSDPVTGFMASPTLLSGTLRAFSVEENVRTVVRRYQEIQAGDLIVDIPAPPLVTVWVGNQVSGTVPLDGMDGVRFERPPGRGKFYVQGEIGEELADAWRTIVGDQELFRTILLRKKT